MTVPAPVALAVLVTYHDEGPLLTRCLQSLRGQTVPVDEVLVYDDASTLRPEAFLVPGVPTRVVRGDSNIGPARGRNRLLGETQCPLVHFHDADDDFGTRWSERVRSAFDAPAVDAVLTEITLVSPEGDQTERMLGLQEVLDGADLVRFCIRGAVLPAAGTYRRDAVLAIGGYREDLWQSEDWDFHVRLAAAGGAFCLLTEPLVRVYGREAGRSRQVIQVWQSAVEAIRRLAGELPERYRSDLAEAAARAGSRLFRAGGVEQARAAFQLAHAIGTPEHVDEQPIYRVLARHAGQEWAERLGSVYRRCLPEGVRVRLARRRA